MMIKKLAKITKANLSMVERGDLSFWIFVDYEEGMSQGVGGFSLDKYCKEKEKRIGTVYGCEVIRQLLIELEVDDFSEMKGEIIWVLGKGKGLSFKPAGIKRLNINGGKTKGVIFSDIAEEFIGEEG